MKNTLSILLIFFTVSVFGQKPKSPTLTVKVTGIKKLKGNVKLGIFNNSTSFLVPGKEYKSATKKVTDKELTFVLSDLPKGTYAFSLFHDVNSDNECNLNFLGIPVEPYAFSNNFKPKLSKPKFNDCIINLDGDKSVAIRLID